LAGAYDAIKMAGRPLHVTDLLAAMGRQPTRGERSAVSGTLAAYVRRGEVFTRPAPNTFGLLESNTEQDPTRDAPPAGFGQI
jgi:hypothetical protein